jgi:hypothetical protein
MVHTTGGSVFFAKVLLIKINQQQVCLANFKLINQQQVCQPTAGYL